MKRLVLVGGGHAHIYVLAALAKKSFADTQVSLVTPYRRQIYSGMLPGWIAGHYGIDDCALALDVLAEQADVAHLQTACVGLDLAARRVYCADGTEIPYDVLSLDTGPVASVAGLDGALEHGLPIRPIEGFVAAWPGVLARARQSVAEFNVVVVGDGAAGVELAFALRTRLMREEIPHARVTLLGAQAEPLGGFPDGLRMRAQRLLRERGVAYLPQKRATAIFPDRICLADGTTLPAAVTLLVTGAAAPAWLASSGLETDENGFVRVNANLQSVSHSEVFAAGDVAAYARARPKSGVFAVRAGPPLADNLRAYFTGNPLRAWRAQKRALSLISTGEKHALASWGGLTASGGWVWNWKNRIDRAFIARFSGRRNMPMDRPAQKL